MIEFDDNAGEIHILTYEQEEWGEEVSIGALPGVDQQVMVVKRPMNRAAQEALARTVPWALVALVLHDRLATMEARLTALETP